MGRNIYYFSRKNISIFESKNIAWTIIGSLAIKLQGCTVAPNDIDIVAKEPSAIDVICELKSENSNEQRKKQTIQNEESDE